MVTGTLLLQRVQDYQKILKYILRVIVVLIAWSFLYSCYQFDKILSIEETKTMLIDIITNKPVITPLWYLYALIGLYIMMPFISKMTLSFENKDYQIFLCLWCLFNAMIPEINSLIGNQIKFVSYFQYQIFTGWSGFLVLGFYLYNREKTKSTLNRDHNARFKILGIKIGAGILLLAIGVLSVIITNQAKVIDNAGFMIVVILSGLIYSCFIKSEEKIKHLYKNNRTLSSLIRNVSEATFGIYLLHRLMISVILHDLPMSPRINPLTQSLLGILLFDVVLYWICFCVVWIIKKIPVIRKLV